jgi:hypothetical protein
VIATAVNIGAVVIIQSRESCGINRLIVFDCGVNILSMVAGAISQAGWFVGQSWPACVASTALLIATTTWNRLVPVAIVVFRYLMVCQAVWVHNLGGEKPLLRRILAVVAVFCTASSGLVLASG